MANNPQFLQIGANRKLSSDEEIARYLDQVAQAKAKLLEHGTVTMIMHKKKQSA